MRSFEIHVAPPASAVRLDPKDLPRVAPDDADAPAPAPPLAGGRRARAATEVLDLFVEGANVTARVEERRGALVLRDLAQAALALAEAPRGKRLVRFYDEPLELCLERSGEAALLSLYRTAPDPSVLVLDRPVRFRDVIASTREAAASVAARREGSLLGEELEALGRALETAGDALPPSAEPVSPGAVVVVEPDGDAPLAFGTEFTFRPTPASAVEARVERADVHALLFRGRLRAEIRGRALDLGAVFPFFFAERLCALAGQALDAAEKGQTLYTRVEAGGALVGLRLGQDERLALVLGTAPSGAGGPNDRTVYTFPNLGLADLADAALAFGHGLVRGLLRRDRAQAGNLRVGALRRQLRETNELFRAARLEDAKINAEPEPYRAFASRPRSERPGVALGGSPRLRYAPRWRALVPGIDLRATFSCGERLVVGGQAETFCLHRETGDVLWRVPTTRATNVATPSGLVRLQPDGTVAVHDLATGAVALRTWIAPTPGDKPSGAVVHAPGLPRMFVVTEGDRHVAALDLASGEARWRYAVGRRGALRFKRLGRILYLAGGDRTITGLDVVTGAVVWRAHDRRRFHGAFGVDRQHLVALAGGAGGPLVVRAFDPYSGEARFATELGGGAPGGLTPDGVPHLLERTVVVAARERRGVRLYGVDRETGELAFDTNGAVAPAGTSWLAVDGLLVGNAPTGDVFAVDGTTGQLAWHRALGPVLESDAPRRLEPVLRGGALFVPYTDVAVIRPTDGALLGTVGPCDVIPDLLRVDERGDVYVAEESGHLAAFGVGARLRLV